MKKQLFSLALVMLPWATGLAATELGGIYYNLNIDEGTASVTVSPDGYSGDIVIPETVKEDKVTYQVTSIEREAFANCTDVTTVVIGDNVVDIGFQAFKGCSGLTTVTIGTGVRNIAMEAFWTGNSNSLNKVIVKDLAAWCQITFSSIFGGNSNPLDVAKHLYSDENTEITDLVIPEGVTTIPYLAFIGCEGLTSVTIPSTVTSIEANAFQRCTGLTSIIIPDNVLTVGDYAFSECTGLANVVLGDGVVSVGSYAFYKCSTMASITIGNSVENIGQFAFNYCSGLTRVIVKDIAAWCKMDFHSYSSSCDNPLQLAKHLYSDEDTEITDLVIPNGVTRIGSAAFSYCQGLTSVSIPSSLTEIGYFAFYGCSNMKSVNISNLAAWCNISFGGNVANPLYSAHHLFVNGTELTELQIPEGTTTIGSEVFIGASYLTSVSIPEGVTSIGSNAFAYCSGLTSVAIPNSVQTIDYGAFSRCSSLGSLSLGNGVVTIGNSAFSYCYQLSSVILPSSVTDIGQDAFYQCNGLTDVFCYAESVPSIGTATFNTYYKINKLHVPDAAVESYKAVNSWNHWFKMVVGMTVSKLTYMLNGEVYKEYDMEYCAPITPEPAPEKDGYEFSGWSEIPDVMPDHDIVVTGTFTDVTAIEHVTRDSEKNDVYFIDGRRISQPRRGLNIVRAADGRTVKVVKQ